MNNKPRVRFAPSPTGTLHIGGARTALYNYLLAKKTGGTFILRIEDTDLERSTPESIQAILEGLEWLELKWDEGPYYQTKRFDLYREHIDKLLNKDMAYPCFCTQEELEQKRNQAFSEKKKPVYDRTCLKLTQEEIKKKTADGLPHCIRFKTNNEGVTVVCDLIKGEVTTPNKELDDLVIQRTDGSPTYNFTVVVDDVTMGITHVIRGDDHLNNTPRQIQLYQAFDYPIPQFAHVPMILGEDKKRLSKRHGATSVMAYKEAGYLPQALINYLVRLGWSCGDEEIFSMKDLESKFSLENINKAAGIFNPEKLLWLNGIYIRQADPQHLAPLVLPFLEKQGLSNINKSILVETIKVCQEKVKTLIEFCPMIDFFFIEIEPEEKLKEKFINEESKPIMSLIAKKLKNLNSWDDQSIQKVFSNLMEEKELGLGKLAQPIRLALSGRKVSPGIFDIIRILGKEKTLARIQKFLC